MSFPLDPMRAAIMSDMQSKLTQALDENQKLREERMELEKSRDGHRCHDPTCFLLGTAHPCHDPLCAGKRLPDVHGMQKQAEVYEETIRFMAENAHQAYHQDCACGWWECRRNICNAAQQALPDLVKKLKGPDHL